MPLDRASIQRSDFPTSRKGYDPGAVDDHLARIAGHVELLQRRLEAAEREPPAAEPPPAPTLAGAAADRVRAIVQAAEASANEIERGARAEAERIRSEAMARSSAHVADVEHAAEELRERLDGVGGRVEELLDAFRYGVGRLGGDLARLRGRLSELYAEAGEPAAPAEEEPRPAPPAPEPEPEPEPVATEPEPPEPAPIAEPAPVPEVESFEPPAGADVEGARLIALNMALNGQPREETERYLGENFGEIPGRDDLLDEVYASVQAG